MTQVHHDLRIDIVSDVVCPWCIIGYIQLKKALNETNIVADIHWHPFELNPHMVEEGENLREHLAVKYGMTSVDSQKNRERLTTLGVELGFVFDYADEMRMYNTYRAHQLLHWAEKNGRQHHLKMALFEAFFTHRKNVNDPDILSQIAGEIGLDRDEAIRVLKNAVFADNVREEEQFWIAKGIRGVPAMTFDQTHLVVGAQGVANYAEILQKVTGHGAA